MRQFPALGLAFLGLVAAAAPATATPFFFSTGDADGKMATATRPGAGSFEIESADDFVLAQGTNLTSATFTGLMPHGSAPTNVVVEIYRVFPLDSNVGRTSGPPLFSTSQVPTRVNSPSDIAFASRDSAVSSELSFSTAILSTGFTALNSVQPGGVHPKPGNLTGGNGPVIGDEVEFDVTFAGPIDLAPGHYFFVPQVDLDSGDFLWLSAPKPISGGTGPFMPDLQSWTRDAGLDPDWLRIGTDITGSGPFNATFSLTGTVPEPAPLALLATGLILTGLVRRRGA